MFNLISLCRLCLDYNCKLLDMCSDNIIEKLTACVNDLDLHGKLPSFICTNCLKELDNFFEFRNRCLKSEFVINNYLKKLTALPITSAKEAFVNTKLNVDLIRANFGRRSVQITERNLTCKVVLTDLKHCLNKSLRNECGKLPSKVPLIKSAISVLEIEPSGHVTTINCASALRNNVLNDELTTTNIEHSTSFASSGIDCDSNDEDDVFDEEEYEDGQNYSRKHINTGVKRINSYTNLSDTDIDEVTRATIENELPVFCPPNLNSYDKSSLEVDICSKALKSGPLNSIPQKRSGTEKDIGKKKHKSTSSIENLGSLLMEHSYARNFTSTDSFDQLIQKKIDYVTNCPKSKVIPLYVKAREKYSIDDPLDMLISARIQNTIDQQHKLKQKYSVRKYGSRSRSLLKGMTKGKPDFQAISKIAGSSNTSFEDLTEFSMIMPVNNDIGYQDINLKEMDTACTYLININEESTTEFVNIDSDIFPHQNVPEKDVIICSNGDANILSARQSTGSYLRAPACEIDEEVDVVNYTDDPTASDVSKSSLHGDPCELYEGSIRYRKENYHKELRSLCDDLASVVWKTGKVKRQCLSQVLTTSKECIRNLKSQERFLLSEYHTLLIQKELCEERLAFLNSVE